MLPEEISTKQLTLRTFRSDDASALHAYLQDSDMGRYLEGPETPPTETETAQIIARHRSVDRAQRNVWAITVNDLVVGAISINFEKAQRIAEIGYSVRKEFWGQGIATESVMVVIDSAFDTYPDLQRIQANIHPQNEGSIRVVTRVGMTYEGTLRSSAFVRNEIADEAIYAILRTEWIAARPR